MIRLDCPACGRACEFADFLAGLTAVCKGCGQRIPVPPPAAKESPAGDAVTTTPVLAASLPLAASCPPQPPPGAVQTVPSGPPPALSSAPFEAPELASLGNAIAASSALPEWAIDYTVASLKLGLLVPDIEQRLVARGLTPAVAAAVVGRVLEARVAERSGAVGGERGEFLHRALSAGAGCVWLLLAYWFGEGLSVARTAIWLALPLACIWFPEVMGRSADPYRASGLRWLSWVVLLLIGGYRVVLLLISP